jgi:hypothetical protein
MSNSNPKYHPTNLSSQVSEYFKNETRKTCVNIMEKTDDVLLAITDSCLFFVDSIFFQKYLFFTSHNTCCLSLGKKPIGREMNKVG